MVRIAIPFLLALIGASARAATIEVINANDAGAGSLRQAIADASNGDKIVFHSSLNAQTITLTTGSISIQTSMVIDASALSDGVTLSNNQAFRAFIIREVSSLTLNSIHFYGNSGPSAFSPGGAIYLTTSVAHFENCKFDSNGGQSDPGGAVRVDDLSTVSFHQCHFSNNRGSSGGALSLRNITTATLIDCTFTSNRSYNGGAISASGEMLSLNTCTFDENSAPVSAGALLLNGCDTTLISCSFRNNTSGGGGAILAQSAIVFYTACDFIGNEARCGGAIDSYDCSQTLTSCHFNENSATLMGGALNFQFLSTGTLADCSFLLNTTDETGGAICNDSVPLSFTNCQFTQNQSLEEGGAIYNEAAPITLNHCEFISNFSDEQGGAIFHEATIESTLLECTFRGNSAEDQGGAIYNNLSSPEMIETTFEANHSAKSGGAVYSASSTPIFSNCSFLENSAEDLGGALLQTSSAATIDECTFTKNDSSVGGAIYNTRGGSTNTVTTKSFFYENHAENEGGAIANHFTSPTISYCIFKGNSAASGGGALYSSNKAVPTYINCVFQGNSALHWGGVFDAFDADCLFINCSLQGNSAGLGGGAIDTSAFSDVIFQNCIVWNNFVQGEPSSIWGRGVTAQNSLIQGSHAVGNLDGTDPQNDPLFLDEIGPFEAPTREGDLRILLSSPVVNVGDNSFNTTSTDLSDSPRIQNSVIDLGAYEGTISEVNFTTLFPLLEPLADENKNGLNNFTDYALGNDPYTFSIPASQPTLTTNQLTFSFRNNAEDVSVLYQKSHNLAPGSWNELILGTNYTLDEETIKGSQTVQVLTLSDTLLNDHSALYFRESFSETAP